MFDLSQFAHFHFLRPLWFLAIIPLYLTWRYLRKEKDPSLQWKGLVSEPLLKAMTVSHGASSWFTPLNVSIAISYLAVVAMAGPTWKQQPSPFAEDISPLIVALDASATMEQQDVQPSRLERARQKLEDLMALRAGGRMGLIVYAGSAHSVIPLTNDTDVVKNFLNAINPSMMPVSGKFPEKVLDVAERMFADSNVPGTLLLVGDGIGANTQQDFGAYFSQNQRQLIVYGIGKETLAAAGEDYLPLETDALTSLADNAGGYYQEMTIDDEDVRKINFRINNHVVIVDDGSRPWVDSGYYLLFPLVAGFLLWFRKGWTLQWCVALVFVIPMMMSSPGAMAQEEKAVAELEQETNWSTLGWQFMDLWMSRDQQGQWLMSRQKYLVAAERYENIAWKGVAYYRAEEFKKAAEMFSRVDSIDGLFDMANAFAHGREYLKARAGYDRVLAREPEHMGAQKNRAIVQEIIDSINLMSESQKAEEGEDVNQLGEDDAQTAEGADQQVFKQAEVEQFSAKEIMQDPQLNETWMRQVQQDPSRFLSIKFQMQLNAVERVENND